jgi:putative oxidoreductase
VVPRLKNVAPGKLADRIPENPRTLVRLNGAVHLVGGLALATGQGRRAGALALAASMVPTTLAGHAYWEEDDPGQRAAQQIHFLKNLSMLGGLLLAAVDTEGRPSLMWRARHGAKDARRTSRRMSRTAGREARQATATARREAKHAAVSARREAKSAIHRASVR